MSLSKIYIQAAEQISIQQPLSNEWMQQPVFYDKGYTRALDPNYRDFLSPMEARRMGKLLKRALVTSSEALRKAGIRHPDAIITGTGLGCVESTELFLDALSREGEQLLKPTHFMQSTHNTIGSLISIQTKTKEYNVTYAHKGISFDSALQDAYIQFQLGKIQSAMVGGHDEMTPSYYELLKKSGYLGQGEISGETAVAFVLTNQAPNALCILSGFKMLYKPTIDKLKNSLQKIYDDAGISGGEISAVMTGISGNEKNDRLYLRLASELFPHAPLLRYKHLFGESYTASGLGLYAAVASLDSGEIPESLYLKPEEKKEEKPRYILLFNQFEEKNYSFTLLETLCGRSYS